MYKPEYNICPLASSTANWSHKSETLTKMRENYSKERREAIGNLNKGKTLSKDTRQLISKAVKNRAPVSLESRLKCAVHVRPLIVTNLDGSNVQFFPSIVEAAKALQCNEKTIRRALQSKNKVKQKYIVRDTVDI